LIDWASFLAGLDSKHEAVLVFVAIFSMFGLEFWVDFWAVVDVVMMDIHGAYCAYFWVNILVSISLFSWITSFAWVHCLSLFFLSLIFLGFLCCGTMYLGLNCWKYCVWGFHHNLAWVFCFTFPIVILNTLF